MPLDRDLQFQIGLQTEALKTLSTPRDVSANFNETLEPMRVVEKSVMAILADAERSSVGKLTSLNTAGKTAFSAVDAWLDRHDAALDREEAAAVATLSKPKEPAPETVQSMLTAIRDFEPTEVASLYASASDEERFVIETASKIAGRLPRRMPDGNIVWSPLLDVENESVAAMIAARQARMLDGPARSLVNDIRRLRSAHRAVAGGARALVTEFLATVRVA